MEKLRYLNKHSNANERHLFSLWWKEQINIHGQEVLYYVNQASLSASNPIYGEQSAASFDVGLPLVLLANLNVDSLLLTKFGITMDSDLAGVIHYETFTELYGHGSEPHVGDVLSMVEYGIDRLNYPRRGPTNYQLTEVVDEFQGNPLGGHYVWFWKAKRYEYTIGTVGGPGPGLGNTQVDDNAAADIIGQENFDYAQENPCSDTNVYGGY